MPSGSKDRFGSATANRAKCCNFGADVASQNSVAPALVHVQRLSRRNAARMAVPGTCCSSHEAIKARRTSSPETVDLALWGGPSAAAISASSGNGASGLSQPVGSFPGSYMPETKWLLYAGNEVAPLRRKRSGSFTPKTPRLFYAGSPVAPIWRKMTVASLGEPSIRTRVLPTLISMAPIEAAPMTGVGVAVGAGRSNCGTGASTVTGNNPTGSYSPARNARRHSTLATRRSPRSGNRTERKRPITSSY